MRSTVKLREQDGRFVLDLNWVQADLVMRVMVVYLGHPRAEAADRVLVGAPRRDAIAIADRIGPNEEHRAVTLDLSETPCLRYEWEGRVTEVPLSNSEYTGTPARMCLSLSMFLTALELRFLHGSRQPWIFGAAATSELMP